MTTIDRPGDAAASTHMSTRATTTSLIPVDPSLPPARPRERRPAKEDRHVLMGLPVQLPFGVAACPLTATAAGIRRLARSGYDVLTFKTVRSQPWPPHPEPNWLYVREIVPPVRLEADPLDSIAYPNGAVLPEPGSGYATVNSYGVQSPSPAEWRKELAAALEEVGEAQLLIASVQGSPETHQTPDALSRDFVDVARLAEKEGARAIELNLSCPNVIDYDDGGVQPPICASPAQTELIVERVRAALAPSTRLVAKLSYLRVDALREVVARIASAVDAVSGVNTLQVSVRHDSGGLAFPPSPGEGLPRRDLAGLSGGPLRAFSQDFVESLTALKARHEWKFDVIGMGGISSTDDVGAVFAAGASAVQVATALVRTPHLAQEVARRGVRASTKGSRLQIV